MAQNGATEIQQQVEESSKTESILNAKGRTPPLNFLAIAKDAVPPIDTSSADKLRDQLYSGVFINPQLYPGVFKEAEYPNTLRYWVDNKLNKNCFAFYARQLKISWGEDSRYWRWTKEKETSGEEIEVAELLEVCWLDVSAKFRSTVLSPKTLYEVVFVVKVKNSSNQEFPVDLNIYLPNHEELTTARRTVRTVSLEKMPREKWIEIQVFEFEMSPENVGEVYFSLWNFDGDWKRGLVVKCAIIRPMIK